MKLKDRILVTLLLTMGLIIHYITPAFFLGMKMDFLLISIVISMILYPKKESYILVAILSGIFSAATTSFPGGEVANLIDKFVTTLVIYLLIKYLLNKKNNILLIGFIGFIGTFISGLVFLLSIKYIMGVTEVSNNLIYIVVLPTSIINGIGTSVIYKIVKKSLSFYKTI